MKSIHQFIATVVVSFAIMSACPPVKAEEPSAFGSGFDVQDFYKPFKRSDITPENQQKWPYYKYVSAPPHKSCAPACKKRQRENSALCRRYISSETRTSSSFHVRG